MGQRFSGTNTRQLSITVAATRNVATLGPLGSGSNFGEPFEIAAPGTWAGLLNGDGVSNNNNPGGTSFAAPAVAGVAALIVAGNLATYSTRDAPALKIDLLNNNTVIDPVGLADIPGNTGLTMLNLP